MRTRPQIATAFPPDLEAPRSFANSAPACHQWGKIADQSPIWIFAQIGIDFIKSAQGRGSGALIVIGARLGTRTFAFGPSPNPNHFRVCRRWSCRSCLRRNAIRSEQLHAHIPENRSDLAQVCNGKHIAKATLRTATDSYELTDVTVSCAAGASRAGGLVTKQTQGASFGERCNAGVCTADGGIAMVLTGGQMKHTKTGHVTLLK